jgi:hypothetical protein
MGNGRANTPACGGIKVFFFFLFFESFFFVFCFMLFRTIKSVRGLKVALASARRRLPHTQRARSLSADVFYLSTSREGNMAAG